LTHERGNMNHKFTVEGKYITKAPDDKGTATLEYTEQFILNGAISTKAEARAVIRRLIMERLKKKNPNIKLVPLCQVVDMVSCMEKAEQVEISKLWLEAINLSCVPDGITQYNDEPAIIKALTRAIDKAKIRNAKPKRTEDEASL